MTWNAPARFHWRAFVTLALPFVLAGAFHLWFTWRTAWSHAPARLAKLDIPTGA